MASFAIFLGVDFFTDYRRFSHSSTCTTFQQRASLGSCPTTNRDSSKEPKNAKEKARCSLPWPPAAGGLRPPDLPCAVRLSSVHVYHLAYHGKWETARHQECDMIASEDGVRADYPPCTMKSVRLPRCPLTTHTAERIDQNECCCGYTRALHEARAKRTSNFFRSKTRHHIFPGVANRENTVSRHAGLTFVCPSFCFGAQRTAQPCSGWVSCGANIGGV